MAQLQPRGQVWEFGTLPVSVLCPFLDSSSLLLAHSKLLSRSSAVDGGERTVTVPEVSRVFELTSNQADVLLEVLSALSLCNDGSQQAVPGQERIYVHELSMFLLAQLFSKEAQRPDNVEYWPEGGASPSTSMELLSPTRQLFKAQGTGGRTMMRQQLQQHLRNQHSALRGFGDYLRRNLKLILELAQDPTPSSGDPCKMTARELDRASFLFMPLQGRPGPKISSLVPAFLTITHLTVDQVLAALKQTWFEDTLDSPRLTSFSSSMSPSPKAFRSIGLAGPSGQVEESRVSGVHKGTVVRGELDCPSGQLHITDCHDTVVYALAPLQWVFISGCSDCTIVVGAVGRILRAERCDKVQIIAAANRVVVSSCHDCTLYLAVLRPPVLMGDNRFLRLAPFNTRYDRQLSHLRDAGIRLDMTNKWDSPVVLQGRDRRGMSSGPDSPRSFSMSSSPSRHTFSLLPPDDFLPYVVPFQGGSGVLAGGPAHPHATRWSSLTSNTGKGAVYLFPLPADYERALQRKLGMTNEMRARFKQANLGKDKERELNDAIQAHFREWLQSSSLLRQIYDLSNLERDEVAADGAAAMQQGGGPQVPGGSSPMQG